MTNIASEVTTLKMNIRTVHERLCALPENYTVLRASLLRDLAEMEARLDAILYPTIEYDPNQEPDDEDDI